MISIGEKVHVIYRALYDGSLRRHFVGEVIAAEGAVVRLRGHAFVTDPQTRMFERREATRETVIDLGHPGYIANVIDPDTVISDVTYRYIREIGLVCTDDGAFALDINEYGSRS